MIRSLLDLTWWQLLLCLAVPINYLAWWLVGATAPDTAPEPENGSRENATTSTI